MHFRLKVHIFSEKMLKSWTFTVLADGTLPQTPTMTAEEFETEPVEAMEWGKERRGSMDVVGEG